ncbi:MAG TPA: hypothetical protein VKB12_15875 [Pyrinomonadaceae bacterium]|nr:hypothetical protein [Pyrinomonadaceae bacterium]
MKKTTLTILAAALFAASAAAYTLAQKKTDAPAAQTTESKTTETDAHHSGDGPMNHADCPLMRADENSRSQHDSHGAHDAALGERGERAMGFSQTATVHHFLLEADGGRIQVEVKDASDTLNRDRVRQHLSQVARAFAAGDFETPALVHARVPPGTDAMRRLKSEITYAYEETEAGARVRINTKNAEALAAVHEFLRFQIEDHRTGDPMN